MKKLFGVFIMVTAIVLCTTLFPAEAEAATIDSGMCGDNLTWTLDDQGTLTISGTGAMRDYDYSDDYEAPWYSSRSSIQKVIIGNSVTSIGEDAFRSCSKLTSVTIPNSVTTIGSHAFYDCDSLTSVTIPSSVTTIGNSAFSSCSNLTSVTIPNSVTTIGDDAFYYCTNLTNVTIPNGVTTIGNSAFRSCSKLTSVTIPSSVTSIGNDAFYNCGGLSSITVAANNPNYSSDAQGILYNKNKTTLIQAPEAITTCVIPNSVTTIGSHAFYDCDSLTSVTIPNSVTSIGNDAFYNCTSLSYNIYDNGKYLGNSSNRYLVLCDTVSDTITSLQIHSSTRFIGADAFYNCKSLTSVTIPNSVTSIGDDAFYNCTGLTSVHITNIAAWCAIDFQESYSNPLMYAHNLYLNGALVVKLTIPSGVTTIGNYAFYGCTSLTSVTIGSSVASIGNFAFYGCTGLTSVTIGSSVTTIGNYAFYGCTGLTSVTIGSSVASIGNSAFRSCSKLTSVTIPSSVTTIGDYAFYGCTGLTSVTIPSSVTTIGNSAFSSCSNLTSVTVGKGIKTIGNYAFSGCINLTGVYITDVAAWCAIDFQYSYSNPLMYAHNLYLNGALVVKLTIPNTVTSIGDYAFYNCTGLTSVTMGTGVTSIGYNAFYACTNLTDVYIKDPSAWCKRNDSSSYIMNYVDQVHILDAYGNEATKVVLDNTVTTIPSNAFYNCDSLTTVSIPSSVTSISSNAFVYCDNLTAITVSASNPNFSSDTQGILYNKDKTKLMAAPGGIWSCTIPSTVTSINYTAFAGCSRLTNIVVPESVTEIGRSAFNGCSGLQSITLPFVGNELVPYNSYYGLFGYIFGTASYEGGTATTQYYQSYSSATFYIPSSLKSVTITGGKLHYGAFYNCSGLTSITLGNGVTSIGERAFYNCNSLTDMVIPNSVTTIDDSAFYYCNNLTSITFGTGLAYIGWNAFSTCSKLSAVHIPNIASWCNITFGNAGSNPLSGAKLYINGKMVQNIVIPEGVTTIGKYAFYNYDSMTGVTIPSSVTSIEDSAFYSCDGLTSVTVSNSVATIGYAAFQNCANLTGVSFGRGLTTIGRGAFKNCDKLISVTIPGNVATIEYEAFYDCDGLTSVNIGAGATSIGYSAFYDCNSLSSVTIGDGATGIGASAFYGCNSLTGINIPNSVTAINSSAFYGCTSLANLTLGSGITTIGDKAFYNCDALTGVAIPNKTVTIGTEAFYDCDGLTSVTLGNNTTTIGKDAFYSCNRLSYNGYGSASYLGTTQNPYHALISASYSFSGSIHADTKIICHSAFRSSSLTKLTIPNGVTTIGDEAFYYCTSLTSVTIPNSITSIGTNAFYGCSALTYNEYDNAKYLGNSTNPYNVLMGATSNTISSCRVHSNTRIIYHDAFSSCTQLTDVTYCGTADQWNRINICSGNGYLTKANRNYHIWTENSCTEPSVCTLCGAVSEGIVHHIENEVCTTCGRYGTCGENLQWWLDEQNTLIITGSGKMKDYTDSGAPWHAVQSSIKKVIIGNRVTSIGGYAFYGCNQMTDVSIPDGVTSIGICAFANCSSLTSVVVPSSTIQVCRYAFQNCTSLKSASFYGYTLGHPTLDSYGYEDYKACVGYSILSGCSSLEYLYICDIEYEAWISNVYNYRNYYPIGYIFGMSSYTGSVACKQPVYIGDRAELRDMTFYFPETLKTLHLGGYNFESYTGSGYTPAMDGCSTIKEVILDDGLRGIPDCTFYGMTGLESITIPDSITTIEGLAFYGCINLTNVTYCGTEEQWNSIKIENINEPLLNAVRKYHIHAWIGATCTSPMTCSICDATLGEPMGHIWESSIVTKEPTATTVGVKTSICSFCGGTVDQEILFGEELSFRNDGALNLESFIGAQFSTTLEIGDKYDRVYIEITHDGKVETLELVNNGTVYYAEYGLAAKKMADVIDIRLFAAIGENIYAGATIENWSVKSKLVSMLDKYYPWMSYGGAYETTPKLAAATLAYGAAAQKQFGYNVDNLATDGVKAEYLALVPTEAPAMEAMPTFNNSGYHAYLYNPAFMLDDVIKASLTFAVGDTKIENYKARVNINGVTEDYELTQYVANGNTYPGYAYIIIDSIVAADLRQDFTVTIMKGETAVSTTYTFSMENMAAKLMANRPDMITAIMNYADAAYARFR